MKDCSINETLQEPLVSIAVATYKGEMFLGKQLDSLLSQTYTNFEVIISDDGSADNTHRILNEFSVKDNRIKWSLNPKPDGFIKNFERAISLCKGEIIFLCDQDDIWYKDKLAKHVEVYKNKKIVWVYNKVVLTNSENKKIGYLEDSALDYYRNKTALENTWGSCILGCATSYRAEDLHKILPAGKFAPAHDSWIQLALYPKKSFFIDEYLQDYRIHKGNTFGLGEKATKEREQLAVKENILYLKNLPMNKNLSFGKRLFFKAVFIAKMIRSQYRNL
ncbi:MAG: glycosyltransferase [Candidatus Paceibacterota bacterium]|jgi:glycosyltransferase involved in cell wall biosynthesis